MQITGTTHKKHETRPDSSSKGNQKKIKIKKKPPSRQKKKRKKKRKEEKAKRKKERTKADRARPKRKSTHQNHILLSPSLLDSIPLSLSLVKTKSEKR